MPEVNWNVMPGAAKDIGIGTDGSVWVIGDSAVPGGYGIYRYNGAGWDGIDGAAVRIAVDPHGQPWVVNDADQIFRRGAADWELMPGAAKDIGIGADGSVWVIGNNAVPGGYGIYRYNGAGWDGIDGAAVRIAVDPHGQPWVVNDGDQVFQRSGYAWQHIAAGAKDVGIGADGTVWVIGNNAVPGGYGIYRWTGGGWEGFNGGAVAISVDPHGQPWVVNDADMIFQYGGAVAVAGPTPAQTHPLTVVASNQVGNHKQLTTFATIYTNGLLALSTISACQHLSEGLRGRVFVVCVDSLGQACWVSQKFACTTAGSVLDLTTPSVQTDTFSQQFPDAVGKYTVRLDIYHSDGDIVPWTQMRDNLVEGVKTATTIAKEIIEVVGLLS
ncbi:MAG: tectonin domain-containing protein [Anaerolineae bacterium]